MKLRLQMDVSLPDAPDHLFWGKGSMVDVADVSDEDLVRVADSWKESWLRRARERRAATAKTVQTVPPAPEIQS